MTAKGQPCRLACAVLGAFFLWLSGPPVSVVAQAARPLQIEAAAQPMSEENAQALLVGASRKAELIVTRTRYRNEEAFRFPVLMSVRWWNSFGYLYVSRDWLAFDPVFSPNRRKYAFELPRAKASSLSAQIVEHGIAYRGYLLLDAGTNQYHFAALWMEVQKQEPDPPMKFRGISYGERPQIKALDKLYDNWIIAAVSNFDETEQKFRKVAANSVSPSVAEQEAALSEQAPTAGGSAALFGAPLGSTAGPKAEAAARASQLPAGNAVAGSALLPTKEGQPEAAVPMTKPEAVPSDSPRSEQSTSNGYLGVSLLQPHRPAGQNSGSTAPQGVIITYTQPGSPAAKAGLEDGEVILKLNGRPVNSVPGFTAQLREMPPGRPIQLEVLRNGKTLGLVATLGTRPTPPSPSPGVQGVVVKGRAVLEIVGSQADIAEVRYQGEPALRFPVFFTHGFLNRECDGSLFITPDRVAFAPTSPDCSQWAFDDTRPKVASMLDAPIGGVRVAFQAGHQDFYLLSQSLGGGIHLSHWINLAWSNFAAAMYDYMYLVSAAQAYQEGAIINDHAVVALRTIQFVTFGKTKNNGDLTFAFPVAFTHGLMSRTSRGWLLISQKKVIYQADPAADSFDVPRSEVSSLAAKSDGSILVVLPQHKYDLYSDWQGDTDKNFRGWAELAWSNFNLVEEKFRAITANAAAAISPKQRSELAEQVSAGDSAAQSGKLYDALHDYEAAFQALPTQWAPQDVENRLEKKTIKLVQRMNPKPAIPQDAMRHMAYAETAFQEAKGPADFDNAIQELNKALRLAPWWGAAYKNLGLLDEKANRDADAARNLQLYLLATPNAPDAQSVQMKIYSLQYKAKQQVEGN